VRFGTGVLGGAGLAKDLNVQAAEDLVGRAAAVSHHRAHGLLNHAEGFIADGQFAAHRGGKLVSGHAVGRGDFLHHLRAVERAAVADGGDEINHLQGRDQHGALPNGKLHRLGLRGRVVNVAGVFFQCADAGGGVQAKANCHV